MSENKNDLKEKLNLLPEEELIKLAKIDVEIEDNIGLNEAQRFIMAINIKSGNAKVPGAIIYERYLKWKKDQGGKNIQNKNSFMKDMAKFFQSSRTRDYRYYLLNPEPFDLTDEKMQEYREKLDAEKKKMEEIEAETNRLLEQAKKDS